MCCICLDTVFTEIHQLPECGHSFHSNCIIAWFRKGNKTCPLCKDEGTVQINSIKHRFKLLRNFCRTEKAPEFLVTEMQKFDVKRKQVRKIKQKLREYEKKANGNYKSIQKQISKRRANIYKAEKNLRYMKRVISSTKVDQIIIPIRRIIYALASRTHTIFRFQIGFQSYRRDYTRLVRPFLISQLQNDATGVSFLLHLLCQQ